MSIPSSRPYSPVYFLLDDSTKGYSRIIKFLLASLLLIFHSNSQAQNQISFQHYTAQNGLPDNKVNSIVQDQDGYMWIGTAGGLCRFDGHQFTNYYSGSNPNSVSGNNIKKLIIQSNNRIWIGTGDGGLSSLDANRKIFKRHKNQNENDTHSNVNCLQLSPTESELLIGFENGGLYKFDVGHEEYVKNDSLQWGNRNSVYDILYNSENEILFSQSGRAIDRIIDGRFESSGTKYAYPHPAHTVSFFFKDSTGRIWLGAWSDRLFEYHGFGNDLDAYALYGNEKPNLSGNEIICINQSNTGELWLGTKLDGLFIFNPETKQFKHFSNKRSEPLSLRGKTINCIYKDTSGRMWVGTDEGLNVYDPLLNQFNINYLSNEDDCHVYCFLKESNQLLIGTSKGLFIRTQDGTHKRYTLDKYFQNESVRSLYRDKKGRLWIGTQHGIYHWNESIKNVSRLSNDNCSSINHTDITSSYVHSIFEYPHEGENAVWAFVLGHGFIVFPDDRRSYCYIPRVGQTIENLVRKTFVDAENNLWIAGSVMGISKMSETQPDMGSNKSRYLQFDAVSATAAGVTNGVDITQHNGVYWYSSRGQGIGSFTRKENQIEATGIEMPYRSIQGINIDKNGTIWMIGPHGIGKYLTDKKQSRFFNEQSGVPTDGLSGYIYKDKDGVLYSGGNGYYLHFQPENVKPAPAGRKVIFSNLRVLDHVADSLLLNSCIELTHLQNSVSVTCTALNYSNPSDEEYLYLLEGLSKEWQKNENGNVLTFVGLPPGKYALRVKVRNSDGIECLEQSVLEFHIQPPFYKTWLFYMLIASIVGGLAFIFYRSRVQQLMAMLEMRNKIARDLHDDVGSALGSISMYSEAVKQQLKGQLSPKSSETLEKIGHSSRQMIEQMSDIVWSVDPRHDSMMHVVKRMQNFGDDLFVASSMRFRLVVSPDCLTKKLDMEERKSIFLIYKEALYNSLKYSEGSQVEARLDWSGNELSLLISDDGKGFDVSNADSYNGNGLRNMQIRAQNVLGALVIESSSDRGTKIHFTIRKKRVSPN